MSQDSAAEHIDYNALVDAEAAALFDAANQYLRPEDVQLLRQAFATAREAHEGQTRKSGEPYITHPLAVAAMLTDWRLDAQGLAAALMHAAQALARDSGKTLLVLDTVTGGDAELQAYLQRMAGYCLTGVTTEHALFFLYGTGANGKSVFVNTLADILGDYATNAPMDTFMETRTDRHPTDMAGLRGARFVAAIETEQGTRGSIRISKTEDKVNLIMPSADPASRRVQVQTSASEAQIVAALTEAGFPPESLDTRADVDLSMDGGPQISSIRLKTRAKVPGIDAAKFRELADDAKQNCPVSKALSAVPVTLEATLL